MNIISSFVPYSDSTLVNAVESFEARYGFLHEDEKMLDLKALALRIEQISRINWWTAGKFKEAMCIIKQDANGQPLPTVIAESEFTASFSLWDKTWHYFKMALGSYYKEVIDVANRQLVELKKVQDVLIHSPLNPSQPFQDLNRRCRRLKKLIDEERMWTQAAEPFMREGCKRKTTFLKKVGLQDYILNKWGACSLGLDSKNFGFHTVEDFIKRKEHCFTTFTFPIEDKEQTLSVKGLLPYFSANHAPSNLQFEVTYQLDPLNEKIIASFDIQKNQVGDHKYLLIHYIEIFPQGESEDGFLFHQLTQFAIEIFEKEAEPCLQIETYDLKTAYLLYAAGMTTLDAEKDAEFQKPLKQRLAESSSSEKEKRLNTTWFLYKRVDSEENIRFYKDRQGIQEAHVCFERDKEPVTWNVYLQERRMLNAITSSVFP